MIECDLEQDERHRKYTYLASGFDILDRAAPTFLGPEVAKHRFLGSVNINPSVDDAEQA
ncbi:hypothetical protein PMIN02_007568 [Paraphaeosphaeria minitans]